jgi:hypothetical protein
LPEVEEVQVGQPTVLIILRAVLEVVLLGELRKTPVVPERVYAEQVEARVPEVPEGIIRAGAVALLWHLSGHWVWEAEASVSLPD